VSVEFFSLFFLEGCDIMMDVLSTTRDTKDLLGAKRMGAVGGMSANSPANAAV